MPLVDSQIRSLVFPNMIHAVEGVSAPGVISYGLTSCGYDFRLGRTAKLFRVPRVPTAGSMVVDPKRPNPDLYEEVSVGCGGVFIIPPHSYMLGYTVEWIEVRPTMMLELIGKSTYARCGIILNCTPIEPGWQGHITLEIANTTPLPAAVYADEGIAQGTFWPFTERPERIYGERGGKYQGQAATPVLAKA